ncbi:MAG: GDSL-type esterase/lipase family protein [Ruminiclostridium sp.]
MNLEKIIALFCAAVMTLSSAGCSGEAAAEISQTTAVTQTEETGVKEYQPSYENVKPLGRAWYSEGELICAFSGTGCEFTATGKSVKFTIKGDDAARSGNNDNAARLAVYVDGERVTDIMLDEKEKTVTAFEGEAERTAVVSLVKLSETANSTFSITKIEAEGDIKPTEEKPLYIEFIGDSITCGYGVDDEDRNHHFSTSTEDCTKAYAYKTAQLLDADYSLVSISGYGIISGYTSNPDKKSASQVMPKYYDKIGFCYTSDVSDTEWDFRRSPDIIVINLGTNDDSYCNGDPDKQAEFTEAYEKFIKQVREKNPDSQILCVLGVMGNGLMKSIRTAVENYTAETGDDKVTAMPLSQQNESDEIAADWHPSEKTHEKTAEKVANKIKELLGI